MTTLSSHSGDAAAITVDQDPEQQTDTPAKQERLWTPLFIFIIAMTLCAFMLGQGLNSGTSVYLDRLGGSASFSGILAAVFSAAAAVTRIIVGPVIDKSGRFRVMFGGMIVLFIGTAIPAMFYDPTLFVVCRVLQGIGFSAATTASATAAADVLPMSRLGEGIGYYGLGQALAMSIGPALALFLVTTDPAENLYFGLSAVAALGIVLTAFCRYENNPSKLPATSAYRLRAEREQLRKNEAAAANEKDSTQPAPEKPRGISMFFEKRALPGTLPMLVLSPAFGFSIFFIGLYGTSLDLANPGLFYSISAISMIVVRLGSKSFMDRVAPIKIFTVAIICGLVGYALLFFAPQYGILFYIAGLPYGVCLGISMPLNQSVAVKNTPPERWGATNALYLLAIDLSIGFSTYIWGIINDMGGFTTSILCIFVCIIAAYGVAWITYPKEAKRAK